MVTEMLMIWDGFVLPMEDVELGMELQARVFERQDLVLRRIFA